MRYTKLKSINEYVSESINPMKLPDTVFEMYSVPIYETGHPEYLKGSEIGSNKAKVRKNDVLLCKINPRINRVWVVADESENQSIASSEWIVIRSSTYNPEFLAWYFRCPKFKKLMTSEVTGIGGSLTRAQPKAVAEYPVPVLSKNEQEEIVNILNRANSIINIRKQELQKLDDLIRARFVDMFGAPASNPMGWPETTVGKVCHYIKDGPHKSLPDIGQENGGHPFISVRNIVNHVIDFSTAKYISDEDYAEARKKCSPEKGDMLYSKGGTTGIAKLVDIDVEFANWVHLAVLKFDHSVLNGIFFENMLNCDYCYDQSQRLTKGIANRDLVLSAMAQIKIYRPPMVLQEQFAAFVAQVDKSKAVIQKSLDETQLLFDSLMQKYFG